MPRTFRLAALAWAASKGAAAACTLCDSATAVSVRHQIFEHDLLTNAAAVLAPVPILLAAVLLIAHDPTRKPRG